MFRFGEFCPADVLTPILELISSIVRDHKTEKQERKVKYSAVVGLLTAERCYSAVKTIGRV